MARNGSGTMSVPNSFAPNSTISSSAFNANFSDVASEITNSLPRDGQAGMTGQFKAANGTEAAPSITFGSDTNTGIYRKGADNPAIACGGSDVVDITTAGVSVTGTITASSTITAAGSVLSPIPTGTVLDYLGTSAPSGWVLLNGLTIGNGSSSATGRANADTETLFALLWNSTADAQCPVSSGRGASAAADYAANKTITLPDARGRARFGKDDMGGTAASRITAGVSSISGATLAASGGAQSHTLTEAQLPVITPAGSVALTNGNNVRRNGTEQSNVASGVPADPDGFLRNADESTITAAFTGTSFGSGNAHPIMPPTLICNVIIKL